MATFKQTASLVFIVIGVLLVGFIIILFARGYKLDFKSKSLTSQGILVANASPSSSQIYINNKFYGVTSSNIYLFPGFYEILIKKEGYSTWKKTFPIKGEVVSRTDAQLFSINPSLSPLTNRGIMNPSLSPSKDKVVYYVRPEENELSTEKETGGIFISNISSKTLSIFRQTLQLVPYSQLPLGFDEKQVEFVFSPDEKNILVFFYGEDKQLIRAILTSSNKANENYFDVTTSYQTFLDKWNVQSNEIQEKILNTFPKKIASKLRGNAFIIDVSPDKSKLLYFSLSETSLDRVINPPLIGSVPTEERRIISPANFYIYDSKEDKNFLVDIFSSEEKKKLLQEIKPLLNPIPVFYKVNRLFSRVFWYYDSRHIIYVEDDAIYAIEYDGQNKTIVYAGPFEKTFTTTTSDGKIIISTQINTKTNNLPDLYSISIK